MFETFAGFSVDAREVRVLGEDTTNQTDGVLDGALFPAMIRLAEV